MNDNMTEAEEYRWLADRFRIDADNMELAEMIDLQRFARQYNNYLLHTQVSELVDTAFAT